MKLLRFLMPLMAMAVAGCAAVRPAPDAAMLNELAPTGKLRFGVGFAPEPSTFFVTKRADGQPSGVAIDLSRDLGRQLGRPVEFLVAPNSDQLTDALVSGKVDAALMPVDAERRKTLGIDPIYFIGEITYLVHPGANIRAIADVDQVGMQVVGIANTTIRAVGTMLENTRIALAPSVDEAKANGTVRKAFDAHGFQSAAVVPADAHWPGETGPRFNHPTQEVRYV